MSGHVADKGRKRPSPFEGPSSHSHIDILLDDEELEEAFLEPGSSEGPTILPAPLAAVVKESPTTKSVWPALRRSSVSVRKMSPVVGFDPQAILSPTHSSSAPAECIPQNGGLLFTMLRRQQFQNNQQQPPESASLRHQEDRHRNRVPSSPTRRGSLSRVPIHAFLIGVINAIIATPVMLSFAAVIFRHQFFASHLGELVKLVFLSSALHQTVFTVGSSMPFAVGQVQDVGLIFLSAIASDVVEDCSKAGISDANTLGTVLAVLSIGTLLVGALIVATGTLRLAAVVQYCPLPVVGAYLAAVGWFCLTAGISLASGIQISGAASWLSLLTDGSALTKLLPAAAMGLALSIVQQRYRSPYALPAFLLVVPTAFYAVVFLGGWQLEDVRAAGWMAQIRPEDSQWRFWNMYSLYNVHSFPPSNIYWAVIPRQIGKLLGLYFVVAFGSSMDIAAIQADAPLELDYNTELITVGTSNVLAGSLGVGFTASYIFSQTKFSQKMAVDSPVMGAVIAIAELLVFILPANPMAYLPDFYFASLVLFIGQDILKDWLFIAAKKVRSNEYALLVAVFLLINWVGLETGIVLGIISSAVLFAYEYARVSIKAFTVVPSRSGAVRSFHQRLVLEAFAGRVLAVALSGMIFFGSATAIAEQVMKVAEVLLETQPHAAAPGVMDQGKRSSEDGPLLQGSVLGGQRQLPTVPSERSLSLQYDCIGALTEAEGVGPMAAGAALQASPLVLLLDVSRVNGIDATAARTFVTLHSRLQRRGVRMALTGLRDDGRDAAAGGRRIRSLLVGQGLILEQPTSAMDIPRGSTNNSYSIEHFQGGSEEENRETTQTASSPGCAWFPSMEEGLQWCEEHFLAVAEQHGLCDPPPQVVTLEEVLKVNLEVPRLILGPTPIDYHAAATRLETFCVRQAMWAGELIFERSQSADAIFIVEQGSVDCHMDFLASSVHSRAAVAVVPGNLAIGSRSHALKYGPGGVIGDLDFLLQRPRSFSARCAQGGSGHLWVLTRDSFERLAKDAPDVLVLLQTVVLRLNCLSATHALEALERSQL